VAPVLSNKRVLSPIRYRKQQACPGDVVHKQGGPRLCASGPNFDFGGGSMQL
jgi:hypothetical protein